MSDVDDKLRALIIDAMHRFDELSASQQATHRAEQRRSFAKGQCPEDYNFVYWCNLVDKMTGWTKEGVGAMNLRPDEIIMLIRELAKRISDGGYSQEFDAKRPPGKQAVIDLAERILALARELP
jgi:hypothetical protein